jgi:hypothetical protein
MRKISLGKDELGLTGFDRADGARTGRLDPPSKSSDIGSLMKMLSFLSFPLPSSAKSVDPQCLHQIRGHSTLARKPPKDLRLLVELDQTYGGR